MEVTFEEILSKKVKAVGQTDDIKVVGTATVNKDGLVEQCDGTFYKVSDGQGVGSFNRYGLNGDANTNMNVPFQYMMLCATALTEYVAGVELTASKEN